MHFPTLDLAVMVLSIVSAVVFASFLLITYTVKSDCFLFPRFRGFVGKSSGSWRFYLQKHACTEPANYKVNWTGKQQAEEVHKFLTVEDAAHQCGTKEEICSLLHAATSNFQLCRRVNAPAASHFIQTLFNTFAALDWITHVVQCDPRMYYNILSLSDVFNATSTFASNLRRLKYHTVRIVYDDKRSSTIELIRIWEMIQQERNLSARYCEQSDTLQVGKIWIKLEDVGDFIVDAQNLCSLLN